MLSGAKVFETNTRMGGRRPQSAGAVKPRPKPSWDGTNNNLAQYRLSKDDLKLKLQSRAHKPLEEYSGAPIVEKKVRPDGTEYVIGVRKELKKPQSAAPPPQAESSSDEEERGCVGDDDLELDQSAGETESGQDWQRRTPLTTTTLAPGFEAADEQVYPQPPPPRAQEKPDEAASPEPKTGNPAPQPGRLSLKAQRVSTGVLGKAVRKPVVARASVAEGLTAGLKVHSPASPVDNKDHEMANLSDACEELRTRIVKYEFATNRQDKAEPLFRRAVPQGYSEFLFKAATRLYEYLGESEGAREAAERDAASAKETAEEAVRMVDALREEMHGIRALLTKQMHDAQALADSRAEEAEEASRRMGRQVAFLERSLEFQSITSVLASSLSLSGRQVVSQAPAAAGVPYPRPTPKDAGERRPAQEASGLSPEKLQACAASAPSGRSSADPPLPTRKAHEPAGACWDAKNLAAMAGPAFDKENLHNFARSGVTVQMPSTALGVGKPLGVVRPDCEAEARQDAPEPYAAHPTIQTLKQASGNKYGLSPVKESPLESPEIRDAVDLRIKKLQIKAKQLGHDGGPLVMQPAGRARRMPQPPSPLSFPQ